MCTMPATVTLHVQRVAAVRVAALAGAVVLLAGIAARIAPSLGLPLVDRFLVDEEGGLSAWFHGIVLAALAGLWWAARERAEPGAARRAWTVLALACTYVSFDEVAALHERLIEPVRDLLDAGGPLLFAWVVPGAIAVAALAAVVARPVLALPRPAQPAIVAGALVYVTGALGVEVVGGAVASRAGETSVLYQVVVHVEETLETAGLVLLLWGLTALLALAPQFTAAAVPTAPRRAR